MKPKILICEDEPIVAMDLQMLVEGFGYDVMGPYPSIQSATDALENEKPDAAVLDVRLTDGEVFPVANILRELDVGLIFHSGHAFGDSIFRQYPESQCCQKPVSTAQLKSALGKAVAFTSAD